jgi:ATP-binding protein involved in chromosome partitioning
MAFDKQLISDGLRTAPQQVRRELAPEGRLRHVDAGDGYASVHLAAAGLERPAMESLAAAAYQAVSQRCSVEDERLLGFAAQFVDESGAVVHEFQFGERPAGQTGAAARPAETGGGHRPIRGLEQPAQGALPRVKHVIAVGAGKGGVGKSSVAVNLAVGLARRGRAVGLLDGDIYGPSIPTMLGLHEHEQAVMGGMLQPFYVHGVKAITIGKLVDPDRPLIWRGPMAHGAFKQLIEQTEWGELDDLIIDLPPGTGDVSLTMAQMLQLTGAVIVCTPQRVAQDDAVRAARMFQQLGVEVLGVVENMSYFVGDDGKEYDIFGKGGAERMAARLNLPFLGSIPITMALRENSDRGDPTANFKGGERGGESLRQALESLVENLERQTALAAMRQGQARPTLKIS